MAAAPLIAAGASILGGITGGKGAKKAAKIQAAAYEKGLGQQRQQYDTTRSDLEPYRAAGTDALSQIMQLLGLGGGLAGNSAGAVGAVGGVLPNGGASGSSAISQQDNVIQMLKGSPLFTSQYDTGVDTLLQTRAATGGLRGGDTQTGLAQFGSGLLSDVLQKYLGNLGGLVSTGANVASTGAQLGQDNTNARSTLLGQQGSANGVAAAAPYAAFQGIINQLGGQLGGLRGPSAAGF
jgi:hypothetical protein